MTNNDDEHIKLLLEAATEIKDPPKSWWSGDSRVEPFMHELNEAIKRAGLNGSAKTDVYNRAYEAVYNAIIKYDGKIND